MSRDVLVVGAGPAGSATACFLARAGFDVELVDRQPFPRAKACGDCISPGAHRLLRALGVDTALARAGAARLNGWSLACEGARFTSGFTDAGATSADAFAVQRSVLDAILIDAARAAGATVRTGVHVTALLRAPGGTVRGIAGRTHGEPCRIEARLTVGADGLRSRVARELAAHARRPRVRKVSFTAHVAGVTGLNRVGEMHVVRDTCLGVAPVTDAASPICNVTVVTLAHRVPAARTAAGRMRALLRRFPHRDLSGLISDEMEILTSGPFDWPTRRIAFDGAVLTGDAAGYFDPFTGQGIFHALAGAELLAGHAPTLLRARSADRFVLARYAREYRALTGPARRLQRIIDAVCTRPRFAASVFAGLARSPAAAGRLIAVTGDLRPARDLLSPRLLTSLVAAALLPDSS